MFVIYIFIQGYTNEEVGILFVSYFATLHVVAVP